MVLEQQLQRPVPLQERLVAPEAAVTLSRSVAVALEAVAPASESVAGASCVSEAAVASSVAGAFRGS